MLIISLLIMLFTSLLSLSQSKAKALEKNKLEEWRREEVISSIPRIKATLKEIADRKPFIPLRAFYFFKQYTDENYQKPYNQETRHELRMELFEEIRERMRGG